MPTMKEIIKVMLAAKELLDKGIMELVRAANLLKTMYQNRLCFIIAGDLDTDNPASITKETLDKIQDGEYIKWIGYHKDIYECLKNVHISVLPSYREGLPK